MNINHSYLDIYHIKQLLILPQPYVRFSLVLNCIVVKFLLLSKVNFFTDITNYHLQIFACFVLSKTLNVYVYIVCI